MPGFVRFRFDTFAANVQYAVFVGTIGRHESAQGVGQDKIELYGFPDMNRLA